MCDTREQYLQAFDTPECSGSISKNQEGETIIRGEIKKGPSDAKVVYWAAAPPTYLQSYSGSGLPYANPEMAYESTPNRGIVKAKNGKFAVKLYFPNSFYIDLGTTYVPPHINFEVCDGNKKHSYAVQLGEGIPYRTLTFAPPPGTRPMTGPMFYEKQNPNQADLRTQEQILRDSAFPKENKYAADYWGGKPPY
jgi:hypothetical protein